MNYSNDQYNFISYESQNYSRNHNYNKYKQKVRQLARS